MRQVPEIPDYGSLPVARALARGEEVPQARLEVSLQQAAARDAAGFAPFTAAARDGQIDLIDPWPLTCDDDRCGVMHDGRTIYYDNNHMTNQGAMRLRHIWAPVFGQNADGDK